MKNESVYTLKKTYKKYFQEIWEDVKNQEKADFRILMFLGGKNRGKSYTAFTMFYDEIKNGHKVVYMRNSKQEINAIKHVIAANIQRLLNIEVTTSDEGIFNKHTKEIIVLFASSKNYNNLSGNTISYSLVFYDEYNQNLSSDMMILVENFLLSMNTVFRQNKFKILVCGNTKTKNNIFFNLYKIDPPFEEGNVTVLNWKDYILCIRYDDSIFEEFVGDNYDMEMIAEANPELYQQMFLGQNFGFEDELILNTVNLQNWKGTEHYFIYKERVYRLYEKTLKDGDVYYLMNYEGKLNNDFKKEEKIVYTADLKLYNLFNFRHINSEEAESFARLVVRSIGDQHIFFNDFIAYDFFTTNKWLFKNGSIKNIYK